jgi:hypothetical protein
VHCCAVILYDFSAIAATRRWNSPEGHIFIMPSLIRFLVIIGILAGLAWAAMQALVSFVEPQQREMKQTLPASKLNK